jgi:hypothetical protein
MAFQLCHPFQIIDELTVPSKALLQGADWFDSVVD